MSSCLSVVSIAPGASIQDNGRTGYQRFGVSEGGVMDKTSVALGAALMQQSSDCSVIELCGAGEFTVVGKSVLMAVTGSEVRITLDGLPVPMCSGFVIDEHQCLSIKPGAGSTYTYLHVQGGFDVPEVMGSRSTHIRAGFGGYCGRCLQAGDRIAVGSSKGAAECLVAPWVDANCRLARVRVVWGAQIDRFSESVREQFLASEFTVSHARDRMGVRLQCTEADGFAPEDGLSGISDAVIAGDVQIGGDGMATVLLADRQPTGGYPRIATVIAADLDKFVQLPTLSVFRFSLISVDEAVQALVDYRRKLIDLPGKLKPVYRDPDTIVDLLGYNLIDGVIDAKRD